MSSSRLPGKVLKDIAGRPMLQHIIERTKLAKMIDGIIIAITTDPTDDVLEQFCRQEGISFYRGSLPDVLDRTYQAARQQHTDVIIRLTADCPLIDPALIDRTVSAFLGEPSALETTEPSRSMVDFSADPYPFDFLANRLPPPWKRTLPIGLDVEVCSFSALERAWLEADQKYQREHVMPFLYDGISFPPMDYQGNKEWYIEKNTSPRGFEVGLLNHNPDYGSLRWTVDTPADLEFVRQVYLHLGGPAGFGWQEILALVQQEPELAAINAEVKHKSAFDVDQRTSNS